MVAEDSSGARKSAKEIREIIRQMSRQKLLLVVAVISVALPIIGAAVTVIWVASHTLSAIDILSVESKGNTVVVSDSLSKLTSEVSGLRVEIAEIRGAQGRQALLIVELSKDMEHLKEDFNDSEVILADHVNKMLYRIAEDKAIRARFEMMGLAIPPIDLRKE